MSIRATVFPLIAATYLLPISALPAESRILEPQDLAQFRDVGEPRISPDGRWVIYTASNPDVGLEREVSALWLASWDGRQELQLTRGSSASDHGPQWSPDGRYIAFLSDRGNPKKGDQVWLLDFRGGEARQLTDHDGAVADFSWAPDGRRIVFAAEVSPNKSADDTAHPIVIDRLQFKWDQAGYLGSERSHLFLQNLTGGPATPLTSGAFNERRPAWSPDGSRIAFYTKRGEDMDASNNWDVYIVEPRDGAVPRQLTTNLGEDGDHTDEWSVAPPRFSPDGSHVGYLHGGAPADIWFAIWQVGVIPTAGGSSNLPTAALDRNTLDPIWSPDGKWLYFRLEDDGSIVLARMRLPGRRVERVSTADNVVSGFDVGRDGRIVVAYSATDRPSEIAAVESGRFRQLSHQNDELLRDFRLARASAIAFKGADGREVHSLLMTPAGDPPRTLRPALLRLHGGPVGANQHEFDFAWQLFAAHGYTVVAPNPRGSSGRGYEFQRAEFANWGRGEVADVLAAIDKAVELGVADPQRLGVGGWSWGAYLTNYVIASDQRFKAAVSGAGAGNILALYGVDHYQHEYELEIGLPWFTTSLWEQVSYAFLHADRITTPTLFMGGDRDVNVPLVGSEQMYQALRRLGVPTQLVVYPGEQHAFSRPAFRIDRLQRYLAWYGRYLKSP